MSRDFGLNRHLLGALCFSFLLTGCGGGGGGGGSEPVPSSSAGDDADQGQLIVGITDAPGDFLSYTVDVNALRLTRANGDVVDALPLVTRVDFAELTEVTEFLSIATVPAGRYEEILFELDFTDAEIVVQGEDGSGLTAQPVDANGAPLGLFTQELSLSSADAIDIRPGRPAAFSLDFDLDGSNEVDLESSPVRVIVEPLLIAEPVLEEGREHRVRGVVRDPDGDVDLVAEQIQLTVRPFRHRTGQFGEFSVSVGSDTLYEVDGVGFVGQEGLEALAIQEGGVPLVALGSVEAQSYIAHTIVAGSSVPWSGEDVLVGVIASREGDVLMVKGAHVELASGERAFRGEFSVQLTGETTVSSPGDSGELTTQSLSVGQPVRIWGAFEGDTSVTAERVFVPLTQLSGEVVSEAPLSVDLNLLSGRRPAAYDFAGTGISPENDADPDLYDIDSALNLDLDAGDYVRVRGRVNDFGAAPADFLGRTFVNLELSARAAHLSIGWEAGSSEPFLAVDDARIDVDLADARAALRIRGAHQGSIDDLSSISLVAPQDGLGAFSVRVRGEGQLLVFRNFADLTNELIAQLDAGHLLHRVSAAGAVAVAESEFVARRAGFVFSAPTEE